MMRVSDLAVADITSDAFQIPAFQIRPTQKQPEDVAPAPKWTPDATIMCGFAVYSDGSLTVSNINVTDPPTGLSQSVGTLAPNASAAPIATSCTVTEANLRTGSVTDVATAAGAAANGDFRVGETANFIITATILPGTSYRVVGNAA